MLSLLLSAYTTLAVIVDEEPVPQRNETAPQSSCASQKQNTDFSGRALCSWSNCPRTSTATDCCLKCGTTSGCGAAVWFDSVCYLKASADGPYNNQGRIAVIPGSGPAPSPGPSPSPGPLPATCSGQQSNTDYRGGDMCSYSNCPRTSDAADCCVKCRDTDGCVVGVWFDGVCYMKSDNSQPFTNSGRQAMTPGPPPKRLGSFLVLGDWGYDGNTHGNVRPSCMGLIGQSMQNYMRNNPGQVKFVLNLGDSFYPAGISSISDGRWQERWFKSYGTELTNLPWFSVYGNHDYEGQDRCGCTPDYSGCVQMQATGHLGGWFMPNMSFYDTRFEQSLGVEILALDTNYLDRGQCCMYQHACSQDYCHSILQQRMNIAMDLFNERIEKSTAKNLLIINHYPSDYFHPWSDNVPGDFINKLKDNSKRHIEFFGGHRHNVDQGSVQNISPNNAWLVGGGGGWGCDGRQQGFVVGHINEDFSISTNAVLVDAHQCCYNYIEETGASLFDVVPSAACVANPGCAKLGIGFGDCCPGRDGTHHECCFDKTEYPEYEKYMDTETGREPFLNDTFVQVQSELRKRRF